MQQRFIACLLIFLQSWLLWHFSRQPVVPVLACILAVGFVPDRFQFRIRGNYWHAAIVAIAAFVIATGFIMPPKPFGKWLMPAQIPVTIAGFFLLLQVLESYRRRESGVLPMYYCLLSLLTVVFSFCRSYMTDDWGTMFWGSVGIASLVGLLLQTSRNQAAKLNVEAVASQLYGRGTAMSRPGRWMLMAWSLAGITFGTWYISGVLSRNVEYFRFLLLPTSDVAAEELGMSLRYSYRATLDSVKDSQLTNPDGVALKVYADFEPGYLRGRVYEKYENNEWFVVGEQRASTLRFSRETHRDLIEATAPPEGIETRNRRKIYAVTEERQGPWKEIEVENDPHRGHMFFTPLGADYVQGNVDSQEVRVDDNDVLRGGFYTGRTYSSYLNRTQAPDAVSPLDRAELLEVPESMERNALALAGAIFAGDLNDRQRIQSVESWFDDNYRYSLKGFQYPSRIDRLSYFIVNKPAAHCEFFASAAVVFLRTQGIPARYVTGFTVYEREDEYGEYWVALNRNAHAWAEAFDRDKQQWVVVEATPGIDVNKDLWNNTAEEQELAAKAAAEKAAAAANAAGGAWFDIEWLNDLFPIIGNVVQIALSLFLMTLLAAWLIRRRYLDYLRRRLGKYDSRFEREALKLRPHERRLEKIGLVRDGAETLHQFVQRIRSTDGEPWLNEAADAFLHYARLRYSAQ